MADHCQASRATRLSPAKLGLLSLALAMLVPLPASAVPPDPPAGLAVVVFNASDNVVYVRFQLSPTDPDQDVGTFQYTLFYDDGVTSGSTLITPANTATGVVTKANGYWTFLMEIPSALVDPTTFNVEADDAGETSLSCGAILDPDRDLDYNACGTMAINWNDLACLPTGSDNPGFDWFEGYRVDDSTFNTRGFTYVKKTAAGGIDLAGDGRSLRLDFRTRSVQDSESSLFRFMLSQVPVQASAVAAANYVDEGAFGYGYSILVEEEGNDYRVKLKYHPGEGLGTVTFFETLAATGVSANQWTPGFIYLDAHTNTLGFGIGPNEYVLPLGVDLTTEPALYSVWVVNYERTDFFITRVPRHEHERATYCLSSLPAEQGGTSTVPSFLGARLEDFGGSGGRIADPSFPGINVTRSSEDLGVTETALGWFLAFVLVASSLMGGAMVGGAVGAATGASMATVANVYLGLMPLWLIVLVFLAAMVVVVFVRRQ